MKRNKAIFLDRDGTINEDIGYLYKKEDFRFLPGVIEALKLFYDAGYLLIIITNQSGIARGYYSEEDLYILNNWLISELKKKEIEIAKIYFCPHHPDAINEKYRINCNCRKPGLGMYESAIIDFDLDLSKCYAIGDKIRDLRICMNTECRGYLIGNATIQIDNNEEYKNINYKKNLYDAAVDIIYSESYSK